jgi:hypothetical protein
MIMKTKRGMTGMESALNIAIGVLTLGVLLCILDALWRIAQAAHTLVQYERSKHPGIDEQIAHAGWKLELSEKVKEMLAKKKFIAVAPDVLREQAMDELKRKGVTQPRNWQWEVN